MTTLHDQSEGEGVFPKGVESEFVRRADELVVEVWCAGMMPDPPPSDPKAAGDRQPTMTGSVSAELERIEAVILDALNALHRLRRGDATSLPPAQPEWISIAEAAFRLGVSERTAWRHATHCGANWAESGLRDVDFTRLKRVRPPRE